MLLSKKPYDIHGIDDNIVLPNYDTEGFSSISIIVMLNITIHDNIVILPSPMAISNYILCYKQTARQTDLHIFTSMPSLSDVRHKEVSN